MSILFAVGFAALMFAVGFGSAVVWHMITGVRWRRPVKDHVSWVGADGKPYRAEGYSFGESHRLTHPEQG